MATYAQIAAKVWKNLGLASAGQNDQDVYDVFDDLLEQDIAARVGRPFAEGFAALSVGGGDYVASGIYAVPATMRVLDELIQIDDEELDWTTDKDRFWAGFNFSDTSEGKPTAALVYGRQAYFRPIPPASQGYTIRFWGTVYTASAVQAAQSPAVIPYEGILEAGATAILGAQKERDEIVAVWNPIFTNRLNALRADARSSRRSQHNPSQF